MERYELELKMQSRSQRTISQRKSQVLVMARHATRDGLAPCEVTKPWMSKYLLDQKAGRKGNGFCPIYENLRQFWLSVEREERQTSGTDDYKHPMTGVARPNLVATEVPALEPDEIRAILVACGGGGTDTVIRDRAIVLVLLQTGMRRAELSGLTWSEIYLKLP